MPQLPRQQQVAAFEHERDRKARWGRGPRRSAEALAGVAIAAALHHPAPLAVDAEAGEPAAGPVIGPVAIHRLGAPRSRPLAKHAHGADALDFPPLPDRRRHPALGVRAHRHRRRVAVALRVTTLMTPLTAFAPTGTPRAAHHLDALHVLDQDVLGLPEHTREQRVVDAAPIHLDQQLVGKAPCAPAPHRPARRADLRHIDAGTSRRASGCCGRRYRRMSSADSTVTAAGDVRQLLGLAGHRGDLELAQLFQGKSMNEVSTAPAAPPTGRPGAIQFDDDP